MAFTVEAMESAPQARSTGHPLEQNQFDLPVKEFIAYDPKAATDITGQPIVKATEKTNPPQANTAEEQVVAPKEESVALSPKISALARKEAAQRQREQALKQREQSLADRLSKAEKFEKLQAKIAAKDYSAADELGLTYEEYTNYLLNKQASEKPEEQRYRKVEEELSAIKKAQEESVLKEYQANQALWKQEISKVVSENPDFITVKEWGKEAEAAVLQLINDTFDEDDVELSVEQAAKLVEDHLVQRAEKVATLTKVKSKFSDEAKVLGPPKTSSKTITQNMTVTSTKPSTKPFHLMSESEQIAEAYRRVQAAKQQGR